MLSAPLASSTNTPRSLGPRLLDVVPEIFLQCLLFFPLLRLLQSHRKIQDFLESDTLLGGILPKGDNEDTRIITRWQKLLDTLLFYVYLLPRSTTTTPLITPT